MSERTAMTGLQRIEVEGKWFVLLEEGEYQRLRREASTAAQSEERDLPPLPKADSRGHYSVAEYARVTLARDLIRARKAAGLSQQQLADLTGLRPQSIARLESGKCSAGPGTIDKIMKVLELERHGKGHSGR